MTGTNRRWWTVLALLGLALCLALPARAQSGAPAYVLTVKGPVTPITQSYIARGIALAEENGAAALVIELDTPGGGLATTREIVQSMQAATVPIVVYVAPAGATAASAGTIITLAGSLAAMAPGTSIGAASPVSMQGEMGETERMKAENIVIADLEALTERRGPEARAWVSKAVLEADALSATEALSLGVVDVVAPSTADLLREIDGREVPTAGGTVTLDTASAPLQPVTRTPMEEFLHIILDPNVAFILLTIGLNALLFELSSPGGYVAGVIGAICLVLGFFALGVLPVNWTGLGLILLAFVLFVADVKAPTHGVLTVMGVISFVLGSLVLFNSPLYRVSLTLVATVGLFSGVFFAFIISKAVMAQRRPAATGRESLVGMMGEARQRLAPQGMVFLRGELWSAETVGDPIPAGTPVRVISVQGLHLVVERAET